MCLRSITLRENKFVDGIVLFTAKNSLPRIQWHDTSMDTNEALVTILQWSDKSWNAFMSQDQQAIEQFISDKQNRLVDITYEKREEYK